MDSMAGQQSLFFDQGAGGQQITPPAEESVTEPHPDTHFPEWWVEVDFAPGYKVSTHGRFMGLRGNLLRGTKSENGYQHIGLTIDGKQRMYLGHRVVALAFLPNPDALPVVNHKDGDRQNNALWNLEWASLSQNAKHGWARKRRSKPETTKQGPEKFSGLFVCGLLYC